MHMNRNFREMHVIKVGVIIQNPRLEFLRNNYKSGYK